MSSRWTGRPGPKDLIFNVVGADDAPVITSANILGSLVEDAGPAVGVNGGFETGNLTGWSSSGVTAEELFIGGQFGNHAAKLSGGDSSNRTSPPRPVSTTR